MKKKYLFMVLFLFILLLISIYYIIYFNLNVFVLGDYKKDINVKLFNKRVNAYVEVIGEVNKEKVGNYKIKYNISYLFIKKSIYKKIVIKDNIKPEIKLNGTDKVILPIGGIYKELGFSAFDNIDGDITKRVKVSNKVNVNALGEYVITYSVNDSSGNNYNIKRNVLVKERISNLGVPVLNYHFFYDESKSESCNEGNCLDVSVFRKHLEYLKNNNFKTLTMKEFRDYMYGEIDLPKNSVLITIDDGAMGTGLHNGNKLIPLLEEYKINATLFLITGWWDINNYRSSFLDIESHTHDLHRGNACKEKKRGSEVLCYSKERVVQDLKKSIEITGSKYAFCYPFYAHDDESTIKVKEAGFDLAFIGGGSRAYKNTDKWHIPRFQIQKNITFDRFINIIN